MKAAYGTVTVATLFSIMAGSGIAGAQELTSAQETATGMEARQHVERYYGYYYERNPEALSTEIFTIPWISVGANGVQVTMTEEENLARFEAAIATLVERGWNRSIFTTRNVCVLSEGSAIVSGMNTRTRADGSIMSVNGVSYIVAKTDQGWRTISFSSHSPEKVVRCDGA
ncbi:MAG: hypothetical protein QGF21_10125 [Vicinamibacterales bacterium]|jgi:hypothetical protein|nr:hypothetical protein [Acidobacteriota bacterium]MDP7340297.1 hypothetical protein [Vicinamibacterales bacterium]MDP7672286.1 hypothetical protein [Vicinamibacterales bacterium]HJO37468.1 hypothetical protein [Vicinamibacterales bacterium]|tara:strand:+ start:834 stop:1346 length:513 start_codon:yes stop_codon:yes gene_type:complete